jgi:hypothetical protein
MEYIRRVGDPAGMIERSMSMDSEHLADVVREVKCMRETGRNNLGIALGVIRSLRDNNLLAIEKFTT